MLQQQITESIAETLRELVGSRGYCKYWGEYSERLIAALAQRFASSEVLLTSSGTSAVELALRAGGIGAGDEVLLSAYDYPGNFWAIERVGARPVLLDTEANGWRINPEQLRAALEDASKRKTCKGLIASHLHGQLQDTVQIRRWCDANEIMLIEDACQAIGAQIAGKPAGSHGHAGIFSFGGGKILSAGRGGVLLTSSPELALKARVAAGAGSGPYTMSELQAAAVLAQLAWLEKIVATSRNYFAALYEGLKANIFVCLPFAEFLNTTSFYQAGFMFELDSSTQPTSSEDRADSEMLRLIERLRSAGIPAGSGFAGFHRRSSRRCRHQGRLQHVPVVARSTLTIHHSAALEESLTGEQTAKIIERLREE